MKSIETSEEIDSVFKEIQMLKALDHKNILKIYNCFNLRAEDQIAMILEYLEGGDLKNYLN